MIIMMKRSKVLDNLSGLNTRQLDENTYLIIGKNEGTFPYSNSLLILDDEVVLIDSGIGNEYLETIKDDIDILINSHYHIDHILGNYLFKELWMVEQEAEVTSSFESYKEHAGILGSPIEEDWMRWFRQYFIFHASSPTKTYKPNQEFKFGETKWIAVHTPGHSTGHCCFYEPNKKLMFSSDIDLAPFGPWYGNPSADLPDFIESIKKVTEFDMELICTSHTMPFRNDIENHLKHYLSIIFERDEHILGLLSKEMTIEELEAQNIIYKEGQKRYKAFTWFEQNMIRKHLERLMDLGQVEQVNDRFRAI